MKRVIDHFLLEWKSQLNRKPLILRGARQVGKTHAVRTLGQTFTTFVEINLEANEAARKIIEKDLDPKRIVFQLSELLQKKIEPKNTLLFFDEIQKVPQAIIALRYFYEEMPELHVIAAGSLLDFAIEQVGIPVGRITTLYMYPLSFLEFVAALGHQEWVRAIVQSSSISEPLHEKIMSLVGSYIAIGGMPAAINEWLSQHTSRSVKRIHADLIYTYEQDFGIYAKNHQIKYLHLLFLKSLEQLTHKFVYSQIGEYQKRELAPALELLEKAGLIYQVIRSAGQGIPIGAQADISNFKIILLDVGLTQALLQFDISNWFVDPLTTCINKGEIVEAFIGQELLAYSDPIKKASLFYWNRENRGSSAEVDYLIQLKEEVIPVEVKAGLSKRIKSLQIFLDSHPYSSYGIKFWSGNEEITKRIRTYPLYAVVKPLIQHNEVLYKAIMHLIEKK